MFELDPPSDRRSIAAALARLDGEMDSFFGGLPSDELLAPQGAAWSPLEHLAHLIKSVTPVARAMRLPRLLLRLRFGRPRRPSASFEEMRGRYREALAGGLQAGRYGPSRQRDPLPPEERARRTLERWRRAGGELRGALERWSDAQLDRYQLPHPALGDLTLREMLFFTLYHNAHHARRVEERRCAARSGGPGDP